MECYLSDTIIFIVVFVLQPKVEKEGLFDVNRTDYVPYDKIAATFTFLEIEIVKITEIVIEFLILKKS